MLNIKSAAVLTPVTFLLALSIASTGCGFLPQPEPTPTPTPVPTSTPEPIEDDTPERLAEHFYRNSDAMFPGCAAGDMEACAQQTSIGRLFGYGLFQPDPTPVPHDAPLPPGQRDDPADIKNCIEGNQPTCKWISDAIKTTCISNESFKRFQCRLIVLEYEDRCKEGCSPIYEELLADANLAINKRRPQ